MTPETVVAAADRAREFLARVKAINIKIAPDARIPRGKISWIETDKHSGALRRASMGLTRALAEMRKP